MLKTIFYLLLFFLSIGCSDSGNEPDDESEIPQIEGYDLVWNDEFDNTFIDPRKWEHEVNANGGGNNELQYYTARPENSYVKDGVLFLVAQYEEYTGPEGTRSFTSARLRTKYNGDWTYGRIEVSAKLPTGRGTWPAIWMLPTDWDYGGWPDSGEIDIMEHVGYDPNVIHASIHTKAYNHAIGTQKSANVKIPTVTTNFHSYSVEWTETKMDFYINDSKYFTFTNENAGWERWPFDKRFHLLLNIAVGGNWGGVQGVDESVFPATMEIDYVRVYKKK
jgi:beta-glucanase (GH16 family)